jgi:hypothetical protein
VVDGQIKVGYDFADFATTDRGGRRDIADWADGLDLYYKRSLQRGVSPDSAQALGLVWPVWRSSPVFAERESQGSGLRALRKRLRSSRVSDQAEYFFDDCPRRSRHPTAILCTRLWSPTGEPEEPPFEFDLARAELNEMRISVIELLRRELPDAFVGGLVPTAYAEATAPHLLLGNSELKNYVRRVKGADIGISTRGLFNSNPFKLAEYLAASKAVVSETVFHDVPGPFRANENYLSFSAPEEALDQVRRLISDPDLTYKLAVNNFAYFQEWVRPDRLALRTLVEALRMASGSLELGYR